jgi:hypothetical protein
VAGHQAAHHEADDESCEVSHWWLASARGVPARCRRTTSPLRGAIGEEKASAGAS